MTLRLESTIIIPIKFIMKVNMVSTHFWGCKKIIKDIDLARFGTKRNNPKILFIATEQFQSVRRSPSETKQLLI